MSKLTEKIPGISALILVLVSLILVLLVYVGGTAGSVDVGGEALSVPKFTDALLYWTYGLLGLALGITIIMALAGYVKSLIANPVAALKSLIPIAAFVLIFVIAWNMGTGERMSIIGYEGTDNEGFWAQFSDMIIYSIYALFAGVVLTIIGAQIYVKTK